MGRVDTSVAAFFPSEKFCLSAGGVLRGVAADIFVLGVLVLSFEIDASLRDIEHYTRRYFDTYIK
jgi:hypothetical protein